MTEGDGRPHVVARKNKGQVWFNTAHIYPTYYLAFLAWESLYNYRDTNPWTIYTVGRDCTPETPVLDPSE